MNKKILTNGKFLIENRMIEGYNIFFDRKIKAVYPNDDRSIDAEIIDVKGAYVFPGFVDIHIHGLNGFDVMDANPIALHTISSSLLAFGVTSFLATTMTMAASDIQKALHTVRTVLNDPPKPEGAKILGVHLEGPFINEKYSGAQNIRHIRKPNWKMFEEYLDIIKLITIAVEEDSDFSFIRSNPGITLSIGHSGADFETALASYDLGVRHCTHCFNAMSPLHHRQPGVVGACLTKNYDTEIIADTIHIHPGFLDALTRIIGADRIILITDSTSATGMPDGNYILGGQQIFVQNGISTLANGTLAGSTLTMDQAVRNMLKHTSRSLIEIIQAATLNPARSIGSDQSIGSISVDKAADFVIMNERFRVLETIVNGERLYRYSKNTIN